MGCIVMTTSNVSEEGRAKGLAGPNCRSLVRKVQEVAYLGSANAHWCSSTRIRSAELESHVKSNTRWLA